MSFLLIRSNIPVVAYIAFVTTSPVYGINVSIEEKCRYLHAEILAAKEKAKRVIQFWYWEFPHHTGKGKILWIWIYYNTVWIGNFLRRLSCEFYCVCKFDDYTWNRILMYWKLWIHNLNGLNLTLFANIKFPPIPNCNFFNLI